MTGVLAFIGRLLVSLVQPLLNFASGWVIAAQRRRLRDLKAKNAAQEAAHEVEQMPNEDVIKELDKWRRK